MSSHAPEPAVVSSNHQGQPKVDLVDPHGHHLADAMPKLRGPADFAEKLGSEFRRVESGA